MRLKKGPDIADYVIQSISTRGARYHYTTTRAEAREYAKERIAEGWRVRIFHTKFTLVSDSKPKRKVRKVRKGAK